MNYDSHPLYDDCIYLMVCLARDRGVAKDSLQSGLELAELFRVGDESDGDTAQFGSIGELVAVEKSGRTIIGEQKTKNLSPQCKWKSI